MNINTIAGNAAEAVSKGHSSVSFILPRLYQRFPTEWTKVRLKFTSLTAINSYVPSLF